MQADRDLKRKADAVIALLGELSEVKRCSLYGSLRSGRYDELSDIDIEIDVSGCDNGLFMLQLPEMLGDKMNIFYYDFAPSLIPDDYIVSIAIDEHDPFLVLDLKCVADPHITTVTRQQAADRNDRITHLLKLWTANLKHYARGEDCRGDIVRMARKINPSGIEAKSDAELLGEVLSALEREAPEKLRTFIASCRNKTDKSVI